MTTLVVLYLDFASLKMPSVRSVTLIPSIPEDDTNKYSVYGDPLLEQHPFTTVYHDTVIHKPEQATPKSSTKAEILVLTITG